MENQQSTINNQQSTISIVIPVFNEAASLSDLLVRCLKTCNRMDRVFEIILVDDGSADGSRDMIASKPARRNHQIGSKSGRRV